MSMYSKTREEIESTPGGVQGPVCVELEDDMLTIKHKPRHIFPITYKGTKFEGFEFFEASSMRKIGDKYYFVYSTYNQHELAYATSDYPDRDFEFGGVIISNGDIGYNGRKPSERLARTGNNHGSIEKINGKWYVFYHRQTRKVDYSRQACAEEIEILPNGFIPQVEMTSCGLNGGPLKAEGSYPSIICCNLTNGHTPHGHCTEMRLPHVNNDADDRFITEIENGTLIGYKYFDFKGVLKIGIEYRTNDITPDGVIEIRTATDAEPIGNIEIRDASEWSRIATSVCVKDGAYPLYFTYKGQGSIQIKEIYFE